MNQEEWLASIRGMNQEQKIDKINEALRGLFRVIGDGSCMTRLEDVLTLMAEYHKAQHDPTPLTALLEEYGEPI